jgi:SNF family Na+-dependent transporter
MKNKLFVRSLLNSLGVFVYIVAIALFFSNANKLFGAEDNFLMPILMLLLLVLSATITGSLVLGKPIMLYLENQKEAAVKLLAYTIGWLAVFVVMAMIVLVLLK